jgi:hypothetical protein
MADVPAATFPNFLGGLATQALMQFGEIPNPITGEREVNLPYARYTVQLLEVLEQKTRGNRTPEEEQYLTGMLTDFRKRLERAGQS